MSAPLQPRRITASERPVFPCWLLLEGKTWQHHVPPNGWMWPMFAEWFREKFSHWLPDQPEAPTGAPAERHECEYDFDGAPCRICGKMFVDSSDDPTSVPRNWADEETTLDKIRGVLRNYSGAALMTPRTALNMIADIALATEFHCPTPSATTEVRKAVQEIVEQAGLSIHLMQWQRAMLTDHILTALAPYLDGRKEGEQVALIESALHDFEAMPEASPHDKKGGIWHHWTDGCSKLRAALTGKGGGA